MFKKFLPLVLALLVLPTALVISAGTVNAAVETEKTLNERLLTTAELKAALESNGVTKAFSKATDIPDTKQEPLVTSGRYWEAADGDVIVILLLSLKDGSAVPTSFRGDILRGDLVTNYMAGAYATNEPYGALDILGPNEMIHGFDAFDDAKKKWEVATVSFIRDNIFGIVVYATGGSNELDEALSAFGGQTAKLPK